MSAAAKEPRAAPDLAWRNHRIGELVTACSIEISPRDDFAGERLRELFDPGTTVFVNHPGSVTHHDIVAACARLRQAGFNPVPHIAVRRLASFTQANDFLHRAAGEAEVRAVLIIGGDPDHPVGPFPDAYDLLASGLVGHHGLREVLCGIGASLRALARGHTAFARILAEAGPDALIGALVAEEEPGRPIDGLHLFTFGGVRRTAEWISGYLRRPLAAG